MENFLNEQIFAAQRRTKALNGILQLQSQQQQSHTHVILYHSVDIVR